MNILKFKYKAHKFINYIFYVVIFIAGFLLGFSTEKINFSKLISQVLMIDNVSAYTFNFNNFTIKNVEAFAIDNIPSTWKDSFNLEEYPLVSVMFSNTSTKEIQVGFYKDLESIRFESDTSNYYSIKSLSISSFCYYVIKETGYYKYEGGCGVGNIPGGNGSYLTLGFGPYTNFNVSEVGEIVHNSSSNLNYFNSRVNKLDFSDYLIKLEYNENLFKDNPDFKEVCVQEGKTFAITSTEMSDINSAFDYDYIWFPYDLNGLSKILYDNSTDSNEIHFTQEEATERYFYNTKENIDSFYSDDILGLELEIKGYTDKYSYYGWSAWPFRLYYSESYNQYNIFTLKEPTKIFIGNLGSGGSVHGGGGLTLDGDEEIEISNEYCFYIKNIYEVTEVNIDEWGDFYGTVPTPNGDYEFSTSHNKLNSNTDSFLSQPIKFINSMKDTISFINSLIYEFYISLPTLLRTFIVTVLIILLIMLIMKIGGYS